MGGHTNEALQQRCAMQLNQIVEGQILGSNALIDLAHLNQGQSIKPQQLGAGGVKQPPVPLQFLQMGHWLGVGLMASRWVIAAKTSCWSASDASIPRFFPAMVASSFALTGMIRQFNE